MTQTTHGVLEALPRGGGFLRDASFSFKPSPDDVFVPAKIMRDNGLTEGVEISGTVKSGKKRTELATVSTVCGLSVEEFKARTLFDRLIAISPNERFRVGEGGNVTMRMVELIAPMGKGTRGLIVAPPKAGKTRILQEMAQAIHTSAPETRIVILLVDERPEEVTDFRRSVPAQVLASSSDQTVEEHTRLAELTLAHVRCELECGKDVVVLVDSLTRLVRAFNLGVRGVSRTMSGGIDAKAMEIPRKFFGLARNVENGGSVTVIATALIETGSRMDDYVFEEFKATGNSEIVLDRELAEARIFPAINLLASSTRREELLFSPEEMARVTTLRRWLAGGDPAAALRGLLKLMDMTDTNEELLLRLNPAK